MHGWSVIAAKVGTLALVASAVLLAAACDGDSAKPSAAPTPVVDAVTALPTPSPTPVQSASESPAPAAEPSVLDAAGRWCPTSPADWGESCVEIDFPTVVHDGSSAPEYVYPWSIGGEADPLTFVPDDYAGAPDVGECWSAAVDGFPAMSGAMLIYCPAGAVANLDWVDDPLTVFPADWGVDPAEIVDYRDQDRLYIAQEATYYPMLRAD